MAKSRFTAEQIILKLREAEVEQAKGKTIEEVVASWGLWTRRIIVGGRSTAD